jgi:hypothetical protein
MSFRLWPGGAAKLPKYNSLVMFYDKSFIMSLKDETPFAKMPAMRPLPCRQLFSYTEKVYENYIHTPTEKLLTWEPMAVTITFVALVVAIAVWVIR